MVWLSHALAVKANYCTYSCCTADRIEAVRQELARYNINSSDSDTIQCLELLGEGTYGKVGVLHLMLSQFGKWSHCLAALLQVAQQISLTIPLQLHKWLAQPTGEHGRALWWHLHSERFVGGGCPFNVNARHVNLSGVLVGCCVQVYKGLWKGTVVATCAPAFTC